MSFYLLLRGPLGVGKTAVSRELAKECRAEYISIDQILDHHGFWEEGALSEFLKANSIAIGRARQALARGTPVIFDGNFYWKPQIEDLFQHLDFPHAVFTLKAPLEVCVARDARRDPSHGADGAREVFAKSTAFEYGTSVDANRPVEQVVAEILDLLNRGTAAASLS